MQWTQKLKLRLRSLAFRSQVNSELDDELRFHLEQQIEENVASGMSLDDAVFAARRAIGGIAQIKEECRDARRVRWITDFGQYLRYALRTFSHARAFVAAIIITLGLGIGANTAVFSIADAILLKSLPVREPERLIQVLQPDGPGLKEYGEQFSAADFDEMRRRISQFAELAAETQVRRITAVIDGAPEEPLRRSIVSGNYFGALGVAPAIGRTISPEEDRERGRHPVAVVR